MKRRRPFVFAVLLIGLAFLPLAAEELPENWRNWSRFREVRTGETARPVSSGAGDLVRVAVPQELFGPARSDLADLRVVDASGDEVAFVVFTHGSGPPAQWRATTLSEVGFVVGEYTQVVADTGAEGALHNSVEVTLPGAEEEFFTWVEIAASDDRQTWRVVRERAPLYRFRERGFGPVVSIRYAPTRDRWLRLRMIEGGAEVAVDRIRVSERVEEQPSFRRVRKALSPNLDSPTGESWWEPEGTTNDVPIAAVRFETELAAFHRPVAVAVSDDGETWRQVGRGTIFRYEPEESLGESAEPGRARQSLQVEVGDVAAPYWRVTVFDRSDPPIDDLEVTLLQNRRHVVFRSRGDDVYRLLYGNARAEAPEYDLGETVSRGKLAAAPLVELGDEKINQAWVSSEPFTERHPVILWAALALAVLVVAGMALKSLRQASP